MVLSPSDSDTIEADPAANGDSHPGTNPVKADHSTNDSIRIGAGATSSSFPRSTLAGGAVCWGADAHQRHSDSVTKGKLQGAANNNICASVHFAVHVIYTHAACHARAAHVPACDQ